MENIIRIDLNGRWLFRDFNKGEGEKAKAFSPEYPALDWMEATVPGVVHLDLMKNHKIPDPFYRLNEIRVGWIEEKEWWYRKEFTIPDELAEKERVELRFQGLDTFATIWLNGQEVGKTDNMFIPWIFDVKKAVKTGKNVLVIKFDSPIYVLDRMEAERGKLVTNMYTGRVYGRKAQYSFGWDWGPRLPTSGIWKDVMLVGYDTAKLQYIHARVETLNKDAAKLYLEAEVYSTKKVEAELIFELSLGNNRISKTVFQELGVGLNLVIAKVEVAKPELWWPAGYGKQPLYDFKVILKASGKELDIANTRIGLREVKLIQEKDEKGESFVFQINGVPIFCKGANWIPADSFLPRVTRKEYESLLSLAIEANMNMLRVWGGGIYEKEDFYELCDEKGILIWQEFMFACAEYPEEEWFWRKVEKEAEEVVKRLRNHPSIVLWCGNNENYWFFKRGYFGKKDKFYGETIYEKILPSVCARLDPTRPYWPSSPYGGEDPNSEEQGDRHNWDVWSRWQDYTQYLNDKGRFISEFGFQAPPTMETIETFTESEDRWPQSKVMEFHNKQIEGTERIYRFIASHFRMPVSFENFVLLAQINQGEALKTGIEHWRRRKFSTSGTLLWQLNDCWPAISWSIIDYFHRPKPAYYFVKRAYNPILVSLTEEEGKIKVWVTNDTMEEVNGFLIVKLQNINGKVSFQERRKVTVAPNSSSLVFFKEMNELTIKDRTREFFSAELLVREQIISTNTFFMARFKHIELPDPAIKVNVEQADAEGKKYRVEISSEVFAKAVNLSILGARAVYDDNYFDLLPASKKVVLVSLDQKMGLNEFKSSLRVKTLVNSIVK